MELSKQVTSLEISKRLKELGVKQESLFYWVSRGHGEGCFLSKETKFIYGSVPDLSESEYPVIFSAFTVAELGMLIGGGLNYRRNMLGSHVVWDSTIEDKAWTADTEADARGKMLIYLLENNLLSPQGN